MPPESAEPGIVRKSAPAKPLIGFADPVFDQQLRNVRVAAAETASRGIRGTVADIAELRTALPPLSNISFPLSNCTNEHPQSGTGSLDR
ncbi:MAG: hypothetical protein WB760_18595 [Xanthobacteraceae bacterium]